VALNSATARPGLIILIGVVVIALVLGVIVLIPLPSVERELNSYIPPGATEQNRSRGQTLSAVTLTTTQDVTGVIDFYRKKLKLAGHLSPRSGMAILSRGRLFGGHNTDGIMPLAGSAGQAMTITHRESRHVAVITVARGTNDSQTYVTVLLERLPDRENRNLWRPTNSALAFPPPQGTVGSSGMGPGVAVAEFATTAPLEEVARHYSTNLLLLPAGQPVPKELRLGDTGVILRQRRDNAESILLTKPRDLYQSFFIFCFKDNASTQTQVSVSWASK
jgi:hypothetical protein